ncbi:MAG: hypothetical protein K5880_14230 [Hydrogenophaga sp.]|uniref:hypothetical protein n=1 Tax=Hydrogenophaga sp. TaxID=1904254 RepID=UPI002614845C|nr:hypothetical protein [Hydrogenophaga sp.]MCV0439781.1 hypothetical protein [Hydrogenophaga sp.]
MHEYHILAMRRSGHHGVIAWLSGHHERTALLNDVVVRGVHDHNEWPYENAHVHYGGSHSDDCDSLAINFEDCDVDVYDQIPFGLLPGSSEQNTVHKMTVVRDPFNWLASLMHSHVGTDNYDVLIDRYIKQVCDESFLRVNFNLWFASERYRRQLADTLNLDFTDAMLSHIGQGSSFTNHDKNARNLRVLDRWQHKVRDRQYLDLLHGHDLVRLSQEVFEFNPL